MSVESFQPADPFPTTEAAPLEPLRDAAHAAPVAPVRSEPEGQLATFMYARVRNFAAACHTMAGDELTNFVNDVRRMLQRAGSELGGEVAQRKPDSVLFAFSHRPEDSVPAHAKRALHAAILTVHACV
jgi:class 3 adenylate cyclase